MPVLRRSHKPEDNEYIPPGGEEDCGSRFNGFFCTRSAGHEGVHVAHGTNDSMLATWTDTEQD